MKYLLLLIALPPFFSCNQQKDDAVQLQHRVDSLELRLADTYKPGFGEFMSSVQVHHAKLWFAGQEQNWKLADFEVHEIMEVIDDIQKYQTERKESKQVSMINPALDSVNAAVAHKDPVQFKNSFIHLTNTCNNCHHAVDFEFNVVKIPETPPYSNQDFKVVK